MTLLTPKSKGRKPEVSIIDYLRDLFILNLSFSQLSR